MANLLNQQKYFREVIVPAALKSALRSSTLFKHRVKEYEEIYKHSPVEYKKIFPEK